MAALTSRRQMEKHQLHQKQVAALQQQEQQLQQQQQRQVQQPQSPPLQYSYSPPPSYSQSSYSPVLREHIYRHFSQAERTIFERGLNDYETRRNLVGFVECLRVILNTNQKRQLIFPIREYAVRSSDYKKFNKLLVNYGIAASVAGSNSQVKTNQRKDDLTGVHKIEIKKDQNGEWGFNIRGGSEHGVGIFVSWVDPGSIAASKGLKVGDQILKANDVSFENIGHQPAVQIMSSVKKLRLFVLSKGRVPHTQVNPQQSFVWVDVNGQTCTPPMQRHRGGQVFQSEADERKIRLVVEPGKHLGISIRGGSEHGLGIYISGVDDGSVADTYGLKVGDQILEVNGISFTRVTHAEAAKILTANAMLIMVVKDVGKLPYSRANTQTQWYSSQPNAAPVKMRHPSDDKPGFKRDIGKQVMHDQYSGQPSHVMMNDKAKSLLSESEYKTFTYYITQYKQHKLLVEDLVIALIEILDTTEKFKLIAEVRSVIFPKDMNKFNNLTVHKEMLTRKGRYDFQQSTEFGGSENSLNSSSAGSGSQDSITQNARAILDNFTLQPRDDDSEEESNEDEDDDNDTGHGGIQLKSYVQKEISVNDSTTTPERYTSSRPDTSKTGSPKFYAPPPPNSPPSTSTPQSPDSKDILADTLKKRRQQIQPKDSLMDSSYNDTVNSSMFSDIPTQGKQVPEIFVTDSQYSLATAMTESKETKQKQRMASDEGTPQSLEDKIEEIESKIKSEYETALQQEKEKMLQLQKEEAERREELERLEKERKRQSRANFQETIRTELEAEIRQEYEKILKVEKEEKEQLQLILAQQKINEEAISELESKIREDIQSKAREEFDFQLETEREEMRKREQAERLRREEIEEAQKRMEIERLEAEEQMRIEIEARVTKEAEEKARIEYEERLQRETAERARLAEEVKTHKEIEERLEQQMKEQKEEMERQIALEKQKMLELMEQERLASQLKQDETKQLEEQRRMKLQEKEEQRQRDLEAEQKRKQEAEQKRKQEEAEQKRKKEEAEQKRKQEAEQKRKQEEAERKRKQEEAEQKRQQEAEQKKITDQKKSAKKQQQSSEQQQNELPSLNEIDFGSLHQPNVRKEKVKFSDDDDQQTKKTVQSAIQQDRQRAEKMLQQRMIASKQQETSTPTAKGGGAKEGGISFSKKAGVVGKKGFSYAGYTGLIGDMITITIHKVTKRLGIAVNGGADTRQVAVRIKEIIPGGSAAKTGQGLRVGQQILQINTTSLKDLKHKEAVAIIKSAFDSPEKTMTIIVVDPEEEEEEDY